MVTPGGITFFGTTLHLNISVASAGNGSGTPTGTVTITDNGTFLTTLTLNGGQAEFDLSSALVTTHDFVATYQGSSAFDGSFATVMYTISPASTSSSLGIAPDASTFGDTVTMTDTVTDTSAGGAEVPAGSVTFSNGPTVLGTVMLVPAGAASITAVLSTRGPAPIGLRPPGRLDR